MGPPGALDASPPRITSSGGRLDQQALGTGTGPMGLHPAYDASRHTSQPRWTPAISRRWPFPPTGRAPPLTGVAAWQFSHRLRSRNAAAGRIQPLRDVKGSPPGSRRTKGRRSPAKAFCADMMTPAGAAHIHSRRSWWSTAATRPPRRRRMLSSSRSWAMNSGAGGGRFRRTAPMRCRRCSRRRSSRRRDGGLVS